MRLNVNSRSMKRHLSKRGLLRNQGLRTALILIVGAGAIFTYTRVQNTWVFASEKDLAAVYRDGVVEVNIPYDEGTARAGSLKVEILDPADKVIGSVQKSATATHARPWRVSIPIFPLVAIEDLAWDRLRITSGDASRTVSLSEILSLPVVRIFAQRSYAAGSTVALRVITTESKAGTPLPNSKIKIELTEGGRSATLFTGRTNNLGTAQISFSLPAESFGSRELRVTAETGLGRVVASEPVQLERRDRILLTTDKPIYQPGQTMHLRALALDGPSRAAAANQPVMLEIEDGKGNKVFKQRGTTDRFGIASADFELADEVNFGPYHVRAILGNDGAQSVQEKTVTVDRYVLPKFKIAIEMDGDKAKQQMSYYRPGETVSGKVTAQYLFGKPIVNADVALTLTTFDVQSVELGRLTGKTDADGRFAFSSKLPDFLAGRSTEQGSAPVSIAAEIKDTASHTESKTRNILVSNAPILIMAVPESGRLLPGLENRVYILTSYPDGTPAETELSGNIKASPLKTDASGVATISIEGGVGDAAPVLEIIATDSQGRSARASIKLESQTGSQSLMLRTDKTVFKIGDRLNLATISTRRQGPVYVDVIKDGQTLVTRAIDTADGRGELSLNLTEAMFGTLEVRAYQITAGDAEPVMDRRLIYVDPADDLKVDVSTDRQSYKPGEDATINFRTRDQAGRPVSAALGVEIVDEAVFALSDKQPGFEKIFMYLEKELLTPRYEVHQFSFDKVLQDDFDGERPLAAASRERAAQVLFAAAGTVNDRDIRGEFGRESIDSKRAAYAEVYGVRLYQSGQRLALEMTAYYASHPPSPEGFGGDLRAFVAGSAESANLARDPWGNQLVGEGQLGDAEAASFTLTSLGPDGRKGTADDITYLVYARRDTSGVNRIAPFKGQATVRKDVIAGGRSAIEGIVKDGDGSALGQAKITAQRIGNGRVVAVYSDGQGRFVIPDLAPGHYTVRFEHSAFQDSLYQGLRLKPGARAKVDVVLDHLSITPISLSLPYGYYPVRKAGGRGRLEVGALNGAILGGEGVAGAEEIDMRAKGADLDAPIAAPLGRPAASANAPRESGEKDKTDDKKEETSGGAEPRVRSFFPETLYTNPVLITDGEGRASVHVPMADSITTWRITSLASTTRGSMGSATFPIRVLQDFFADLDVPAAITEGDVISAPVAVYNYLPAAQQVTLDLRQDPWFTLEGDTATKTLQIGAGEVGVAYFKIKASKIGQQQLQVTARLADSAGIPGDAVARPVNVLPNGEEKAIVINERLEGSVSKDVVIPEGAIPDASKILVKLYPGALSQVVEGLDSILRMPGGCFEQTSSSTYPDVLVMDYLKTSKKITPELQAKAEGYISLGYQRLVTFEVPGGGFSWFGQAPANKILTAYGLMEFADMSRVHEVDPKVIERTQNWLVSQQQPDGGFKPDTEFINEGATTHYNTDILRITAYIGWSLAATGYKGPALDKAKQYCRAHLTGKEDAYTLAVLANFAADSSDKEWTDSAVDSLARRATEDSKIAYWKQEGETPTSAREASADLETTALAAQALLKSGQKSGLAKKVLDYLTEKKDSYGNWESTQATILALKAFLLSFTKGTNSDTSGSVDVSVDGKSVRRVDITKDNNDLLQVIDLGPYTRIGKQAIGLKFEGKGSMEYQIVGRYYTPWAGRPEPEHEPLSISVNYDRTQLAQDQVATASVKVRNNTKATAKMIMIDLGIPPGFEPSADDFGALMDVTQGKAGGKLEKYTITARQVILYFDGLNPNQQVEFKYKLRAKFPVKAQAFSSRVYEYYNPKNEDRTKPLELTVVAK